MKQGTLPAFPGLSTGDPLVVDKRISLSPVSTGFPRHHCGDGGLVAKLSATFRDPMDYVAHQALLSMGFSSSGLPFPSPGDLPNPGIKPMSPALQMDSLLLSHQGRNALKCIMNMLKWIVSQCSGNDFVKGNLAILLFFLILPMHWVTKEILPYFCRLLYPCVVCKISLHAQIYFAFLILHFKLPVSHQEMLFGMLQTRKCCLIGNKWKPWRMNQK